MNVFYAPVITLFSITLLSGCFGSNSTEDMEKKLTEQAEKQAQDIQDKINQDLKEKGISVEEAQPIDTK
jgi:hypothetical protein